MRAGNLAVRVGVLRPADAPDAFNAGLEDFSAPPVATYWADVATPKGAARVVADQERRESTHEVTFRGRLDVRPGDRLRLPSGAVLRILGLTNPDGRGIRLVASCVEVVEVTDG